jgi:hypothetical protein
MSDMDLKRNTIIPGGRAINPANVENQVTELWRSDEVIPQVGSSSVSIGSPISGGTVDSVLFIDSDGKLAVDDKLSFKDDTLKLENISGKKSADADFTIILIPDSQFETQSAHRSLFDGIFEWALSVRVARNIQLTIGLGDITNTAASGDMTYAAGKYHELYDEGILAIPIMGNHDYTTPSTRTATVYDSAFNDLLDDETVLGEYPFGSYQNYYTVLTIGTQQYLILALEPFPSDGAIAWAKTVLDATSLDTQVIVVCHTFQTPAGTIMNDLDTNGGSHYTFPNYNNGQSVWDDLLSNYANIFLIVCGHWSSATDYNSMLTKVGKNGNVVHCLFVDYQQNNYGNGTVAILTVKPSQNTIKVQFMSTIENVFDSQEYDIPYPNILSKSSIGLLGGVQVHEDLTIAGEAVFGDGNGVRIQSVNAPNGQTSLTDISTTANSTIIDPPNAHVLRFNFNHGSEDTYFHRATGITSDLGDVNLRDLFSESIINSNRVTSLEFYNGFIYPRHPNEGTTHPDLAPPTTGVYYGDLTPPTIYSGCTGDITLSEDSCGYSTYGCGTTVYYMAYAYLTLGGTKYFSTTYNSASQYMSYGGDVAIAVNSIPTGATGILLLQSTDNCNWNYAYFESTGTWHDNSSCLWSGCGSIPPTPQLPVSGSGNFAITEAPCGGSTFGSGTMVYYRAYSYETICGVKYFSTTYTDVNPTVSACTADFQISFFNVVSGATGFRIYRGLACGCTVNYDRYIDWETGGICSTMDASSGTFTVCGGYPPCNYLPYGSGGDAIPNDTLWYSDVNDCFAYKDSIGNIRYIDWRD